MGTGLRSEHAFKAELDITGCGAFDNMGKHGFRERGDESTQDHLILGVPGIKFWIGKDGYGARGWDGKREWRGWFGSINEAIKMLASKLRDNLGFPEKIIVTIEFDGDEMLDVGKRCRSNKCGRYGGRRLGGERRRC
jgi:hypothetical protein